ncbi:MAG: twin-arginine translocase subunit TatC [Flavobacteriaceae bacterium]|nr:twin-arginine translocase subunit TatC [Flavobacteriaceae bacterium]
MKEKEMSFLDHLEELRWHLIRVTIVIILVSIVAFSLKSFIFDTVIFAPKDPDFLTYRFFCYISELLNTNSLCIDELPFKFQSLGLTEQFSVHFWVSITAGFIISFPYVIWEFWRFISPGLYEKERKTASGFISISSLLFFIGVLFGYYVIVPFSVNFLGNYSVSDMIERNIKIGSYISLLRSTVLASGLVFELPIIIYFLTKIGLVTPEFLRKYRRHALVLVLILAAVITPPDIVSQIVVSIPVLVLYEVSIYISKVVIKNEGENG